MLPHSAVNSKVTPPRAAALSSKAMLRIREYITSSLRVQEDNCNVRVVKMPSGCGGPYARLAVLRVNDSLPVSASMLSQKPAENPVYEMHFDYDFSRL